LWLRDCFGLYERLVYSCVASVAVQLWLRNCHGLYERLAYICVWHL